MIYEFKNLTKEEASHRATVILETGKADGVTRVEIVDQLDGYFTIRVFSEP